ncbi:MAG: DNA-directed RNA polymerase subunit E [Thermoplasmata archaeon]|nr:MAG: DNA-directed RNA polymerase subunit E [Thermoplasmata archaeon]
MSTLKACKTCRIITEEDKCPICGEKTSREWQGYLIMVNHSRSEIAKKVGIDANGKYALKVR